MKKPKLGMIASPMGAVVAFAAMIAILMVISKYKGKQVLRARAIRKAYAGRPMTKAEQKAFVQSRKSMRGPILTPPGGPGWVPVHAARALRKAQTGRSVPPRALAGTRAWRRRWDQISGSSQYSRGMTQGRKLGLHLHMS